MIHSSYYVKDVFLKTEWEMNIYDEAICRHEQWSLPLIQLKNYIKCQLKFLENWISAFAYINSLINFKDAKLQQFCKSIDETDASEKVEKSLLLRARQKMGRNLNEACERLLFLF